MVAGKNPQPRRIKLTLEYDGTGFHGFQRQNSGVATVQNSIEDAILEISGQKVTVQVAGRTDASVHATGQVCHFDIQSNNKLISFKDGINRFTPPSISVITVEEVVAETFQARFDCCARNYEYLIFNRRTASPFWIGRATHIPTKLNVPSMQEAAKCFVGKHDFSAFRSPECTAKSPVKTMHHFRIEQDGDIIRFTIRGSAFLHNMVRIMCGTLVRVGKGKIKAEEVQKILEGKNKHKNPLTLDAEGLYFTKAEYPKYEVLDSC
jgi:tRNA pseudouridine38-40 synthase